jgi:hypothetical protein
VAQKEPPESKTFDFLEAEAYLNRLPNRAEREAIQMDSEEEQKIDTIVTDSFVRCENPYCGSLVSGDELKRHEGKCPLCGAQIAKPRKEG